MLFRWYNDHVHLLMGCDALQEATLYRRIGAVPQGAAEYLCLYAFGSHADFMQFEASDARARAQAVMRAGWGAGGITIVERTQYRRLGRLGDSGAAGDLRVAALALGPEPVAGSDRWLNDRMHAAWGDGPGERAWLRAGGTADAGDALVYGPLTDPSVPGRAIEGWASEPVDPAFGTRPGGAAVRWQADVRLLRHWRR